MAKLNAFLFRFEEHSGKYIDQGSGITIGAFNVCDRATLAERSASSRCLLN